MSVDKTLFLSLTRVHFHRSPLISLQRPSLDGALSTTDVTSKLCTRKRNSIREDLAVAKINWRDSGWRKKKREKSVEKKDGGKVRDGQHRIKMASSERIGVGTARLCCERALALPSWEELGI